MKILKHILVGGFIMFAAFVFLYPNPFGNNPDVIMDESYFLTSSLSAIEKITIPGWEFSQSGNYYGGVQTYIDYFVLIPVLGVVTAFSDFSITSTKLWVALNTGELLHILRLVNGLLGLMAIFACYFYFSRRNIPQKLSLSLTLFLFLLLSNVLIIQFLHTAKVWVIYIIITSVISALFIANEYYLSKLKTSFIQKEKFVAVLVWSSVLLFFQNYVGAISIFLIMSYATLLDHIKIIDIWNHFKKYWYLIIIFTITQISFIYRAIFLNWLTGSFAGISSTTESGQIEWFLRLYNPLFFTLESHPLAVFIFTVSAIWVIFKLLRGKTSVTEKRNKIYLMIALVHPILVYLIFHVGIGFNFGPRYAIFLTIALAFSITILLSETKIIFTKIATIICLILFLILGTKAISLYWHPSSETILLKKIETNYNSPNNIFIEEPNALHLTLPVNEGSLSLLNEKRKNMGRFQFLLQNKELLNNQVSFKPLTVVTYNEKELNEYLTKLKKGSNSVWTITTDCKNLCTNKETEEKTCFEVSENTCGYAVEVNVLSDFLSSKQLGYYYTVRKAY